VVVSAAAAAVVVVVVVVVVVGLGTIEVPTRNFPEGTEKNVKNYRS
jgi:hypothetical protein